MICFYFWYTAVIFDTFCYWKSCIFFVLSKFCTLSFPNFHIILDNGYKLNEKISLDREYSYLIVSEKIDESMWHEQNNKCRQKTEMVYHKRMNIEKYVKNE